MPTPFVTCDGCHENIVNRDQLRVVSTPRGFYFFHDGRDCYLRWHNEQVNQSRKEKDNRSDSYD
jgi:hypothetical protein